MKLLKALIISFSMYSGIPMPQFEWKEEDMKYMLCFFPWIGAVIGAGIVLWSMLCKQAELGMLCYTMGGAAVLAALLIFAYYHHRTKKELGGITGDTAGWFVLLCEEVVMVVVAVVGKLI